MDDTEYQNGLKQLLESGKFGAIMSEEVGIESLKVFAEEEGFLSGGLLGVRLYDKVWQWAQIEHFTKAHALSFYYLVEHSRNLQGNIDFSRVAKTGYGPMQHELLEHYVRKRIFGK